MSYNLYLASNLITPFRIISNDTIDMTTTMSFIGQGQLNYGQAQDQNYLTLLTNSANTTPPTPTNLLVGQLWYNSSNNQLNVYTTNSTWEVVGGPFFSPVSPIGPGNGNLWFNTANQVLEAWNGSNWVVIGPSQSNAPASVYKQTYSANITSDATTTELWINGVTGTRLAIPSNTTWFIEMQVAARRIDSGQEFAGWKIKVAINNTSGNVVFAAPPSIETVGSTSGWTVNLTADNVNTALDIFVTGQAGKIVSWTAITEITIAQ